VLELEVVEVLGERQLGDGELVLDRTRLLPGGAREAAEFGGLLWTYSCGL